MRTRLVRRTLRATLAFLAASLAIASGAVFAAVAAGTALGVRRLRALEPLDRPPAGRVTVIVPCRDAADELGPTLDGLCAQRDVEMRIVAVDDRSTDATPALLKAHAAREPRLTVARIDALPDGWLGKPHACHVGAAAADPDADWLLFVDADARLAPDAVARALRVAEREGAAHIALLPQLSGQSWAGRSVTLAMCIGLVLQARGLERDGPHGYMGVGAFTLVRRDAYAAVGGHAALRLDVVEDIGLARRLKGAGFRARLRFAVDVFQVTWITTVASVVRVTEKNYFALRGYRTLSFATACVAVTALWLAALTSPLGTDGWPAAAGPVGLGALAASTLGIARRYRWSWTHALGVPFGIPVVVAAMANSMLRTLARDGVTWRGTHYPLAELRRAQGSSQGS